MNLAWGGTSVSAGRNDLPGAIYRCDVRPFVAITQDTRVDQIADIRRATVLSADDVIDLVWKAGILLTHQTVFATAARTLHHQEARILVSITSHWSGTAGRALLPSVGCVPDP